MWYRPPPFRRSAIPDSEAKKLYKGLVVTVSASYRPSSKVVGCGGGVWGGGSQAINGVPTPTLTLQLSINELANGEDAVLSREGAEPR